MQCFGAAAGRRNDFFLGWLLIFPFAITEPFHSKVVVSEYNVLPYFSY